jgi:hypothetical protein
MFCHSYCVSWDVAFLSWIWMMGGGSIGFRSMEEVEENLQSLFWNHTLDKGLNLIMMAYSPLSLLVLNLAWTGCCLSVSKSRLLFRNVGNILDSDIHAK